MTFPIRFSPAFENQYALIRSHRKCAKNRFTGSFGSGRRLASASLFADFDFFVAARTFCFASFDIKLEYTPMLPRLLPFAALPPVFFAVLDIISLYHTRAHMRRHA